MNQEQLQQMSKGKGFIAALDQSGGSTPKALADYGISENSYNGDDEMFDAVHQMRTRIITSPSMDDRIIGVILFKETMERQIEEVDTADFLWNQKAIVPFLKVDSGLADEQNGVQMMKPMPELDSLLARANEKHIFGTKMRSVIHELNEQGISDVVAQQFEIAQQIIIAGLLPIIEPEVDIHAENKAEIETALLAQLREKLADLPEENRVIFKLTLPEQDNLYAPLMEDVRTVRVVALSGGYPRDEANERLTRNNGMIASFSRALADGLSANQTDEAFDLTLNRTIQSTYEASLT